MNAFKRIFFISLFFFLLISCKEKTLENNRQVNIIGNYLNGQIKYKYYEDSIINEAYKVNEIGQKRGRILKFTPQGKLKRIYFINNVGDTVGDDSRFEQTYLSEHFFRLSKEKTLFYAKFSEDAKLVFSEGRPFFLSGTSKVNEGDTISFYIASPILPGFKTHITFGQNGEEKSQVDYVNDLRQFTYRKVMPNKGWHIFHLKVQIKDSLENVVIEELDTTRVFVN